MNDILLSGIQGGYIGLTTAQVWNLCNGAAQKTLSLAALKIHLASCEMLERRCNIHNSPFYGKGELRNLTGLKDRAITDGLRELKRNKLLEFTEGSIKILPQTPFDHEEQPFGTDPYRIVPIPRRLIRALCAHTKKSEIIVALIHCARGLFKRGKKIITNGAVRAGWISESFGFGKTVIHSARAWMRSLGFLKEVDGVEQWRKNRWGYYFEILCGHLPKRKKRNTAKNTLSGGLLKRNPFKKLKLNNQYAGFGTPSATKPRKTGFWKNKTQEPSIRDIRVEDLKQISCVLILYKQAIKAGWLQPSEANLRNFVSAAIRAMRVSGDTARIFVGIVKNGLWHYITHEQEDRALSVLKRYREKCPEKFEFEWEQKQSRRGEVSNIEQAREVNNLVGNLVSALGV